MGSCKNGDRCTFLHSTTAQAEGGMGGGGGGGYHANQGQMAMQGAMRGGQW